MIVRAVVVVAVSLGITFGFSGAAAAVPPTCNLRSDVSGSRYPLCEFYATLRVEPAGPGYYRVLVSGEIRIPRNQARTILEWGPNRVVMRLWGEDPVSDDLLYGPYETKLYGYEYADRLRMRNDQFVGDHPETAPQGFRLKADVLDEDLGEDDLYVGIRIVDRLGRTVRSRETNRVHGNF